MNKDKKKVFVKNFGCQMNVRDSEFVAGLLIDKGFRLTQAIEDADTIIFNSCSVRKHAEDRLFSNITYLKKLKKKKPDLIIVLMGCTAQAYKGKAIDRSPEIDIVCGTGNEADLPRLIKDALEKKERIIATGKVDAKRPEIFPGFREHKQRALVSIGEGCDNFCSYCIVPYVRGRERSRNAKDIIKEVKALAGRGFKEVTLLGQNVNSYQTGGDRDFIRLLEAVDKIKGIERIRFMTSHPKDAHTELFRAMRDIEKVCEHLHLPLQSGSDRILKLMNRKYAAKKYLKLAENYKKILPHGSITTDVIVGFPSETDSDFKRTCDIMKAIGFDSAYTFKYSPRSNTKASKLVDDVSAATKARRLDIIMKIQRVISERRNAAIVHSTVEVLAEDVSRKDYAQLSGRTTTNKPVVFKGDKCLVGRIVNVKVESATPYSLKGRIVR